MSSWKNSMAAWKSPARNAAFPFRVASEAWLIASEFPAVDEGESGSSAEKASMAVRVSAVFVSDAREVEGEVPRATQRKPTTKTTSTPVIAKASLTAGGSPDLSLAVRRTKGSPQRTQSWYLSRFLVPHARHCFITIGNRVGRSVESSVRRAR